MKRVYILFLLMVLNSFAGSIGLSAQQQGIVERVYISTDKSTYVAGDRIWCSLFCFSVEGESASLSDFSSTVYLELQTNKQVVHTAKMALIGGRGAGAIDLPPTLPTGNYRLVGYTAQNKNEEGFTPCGGVVTIYNTITSERVDDGVEMVQNDGLSFAQAENEDRYDEVFVQLPSVEVKRGKEFKFSLNNALPESVTLSLSIYNKDPYKYVIDAGIVNYWEQITQTTPGNVGVATLPDYEGEIIRFKAQKGESDQLFVSFPGQYGEYFVADIQENGDAFIITPNIYGDRDMVCDGVESLEVVDPFIKKVVGGIPKLVMNPSMENLLLSRSFSMQVEKRFDADTLYEMLPVRSNILLDNEKVVYVLDEYTRFPKMEEVLVEYVKEIVVKTVKRKKQISITLTPENNGYRTSQESLVMIDGVPVLDQQKIFDFDPLLVERLEIYPNFFSIGNAVYRGVANFITYKKDLSGFSFDNSTKILPFKGCKVPLAYTGGGIREDDTYPDYRQTIYWHPLLDVEGRGKIELRGIAPLYVGDFDIIVEGVSEKGKPVFYKSTLKVR